MENSNFENKFIKLIEEKKLLQWEKYACCKNNDLNKNSKKIYKLFKSIKTSNLFSGRKKAYVKRLYPRYLVENDPDIATLRNKLDNLSNYTENLNDNSRKKYNIELAERMKNDVEQLMKKRNIKANQLGFPTYPDLIFYSEELEKKTVVKMVKNYLEQNIGKAKRLIEKYNLTWPNWFKRLKEIGKYNDNKLDYYINNLLNKLGMKNKKENIHFEFKDQAISGVVFGISVPDDVRVLMKPVSSLYDIHILFHECGHAINYVSNKESGLYTIYTNSFDEIMAKLIETIGIRICLEKEQQRRVKEIKVLEAVRCSISFLFEMKLWQNTVQAENLFRKYQLKLPIEPAPEITWVLDSFRYIDPVYIHNYVLGEIYSEQIIKKLLENCGEDYRGWGRLIETHFLEDGMKNSFINKYREFIRNS